MPKSTKTITLRVDDPDYAAWEAKAAAYGITISGLIRYAVEALPEASKVQARAAVARAKGGQP